MKYLFLALLLLAAVMESAAAQPRLIAFNIGEAQRRIEGARAVAPTAARLGGMTQIMGMVYDAQTGDMILIGRAVESAPPLDLDSLVVAMRAVLALKQWPLVSIDPAPDSATTGKQTVRLEGGIEDSRFGRDFVAADVRLKRLGLGLDHALGVEAYFDQRQRLLARGAGEARGRSRFWFYPVDPGLEQGDGVFLIRSLELGVRVQQVRFPATAPSQPADVAAESFAKQLSSGFAELTQEYPEIARLRSLYEMVAVARGLQMTPENTYAWWLKGYRLAVVRTPRQFDVIRRNEQIRTPAGQRMFEVSGGIQFRALRVRLMDGDATALKEAVLLSRPRRDSLSWVIPVEASLLGAGSAAGAGAPAPQEPGGEEPGSTLAWKMGVVAGGASTQSSAAPRNTGGIDLSGRQNYAEHRGVKDEVDKEEAGAEVVPSKKKKESR